jgi:hypothetical protein
MFNIGDKVRIHEEAWTGIANSIKKMFSGVGIIEEIIDQECIVKFGSWRIRAELYDFIPEVRPNEQLEFNFMKGD